MDPQFRIELNQLSPGFSIHKELYPIPGSPYAKEPTIDDFLQMNIAEIRTTIHHMMQRSALALHTPAENMKPISKLLDSLLHDELAHVAYSARLIEALAEQADAPERLARLFLGGSTTSTRLPMRNSAATYSIAPWRVARSDLGVAREQKSLRADWNCSASGRVCMARE